MGLKMNLEQTLNEITGKMYGKNIGACTDAQLYTGVLQLTKEKMAETPVITGDKKVYYIYFFTILTYDKAGLIIGCCHDCPYI